MDDIYKNIEEYNPNKNHKKKLFVFDDRTADIVSSKNLNPIIIELFIRVRKLNVSFVFITQSYFALPNNIIGLFSTQYMKILLWKFQTNKNFYKLHLIIHQILTLKTLWIFTKMYWKTILFFSYWYYSCIILSLKFQKESFRTNMTTNHDNWW